MAAAFRDFATAGSGQSANVSTLNITIPSTAVAGDYAVILVQANTTTATMTIPSGWTAAPSSPARSGNSSVWRISKVLVSGDVGATVALTFSSAMRCEAVALVASGVDSTQQSGYFYAETSNTASPTINSITGIPAGSMIFVAFLRRLGASPALPAATVHAPSSVTEVASFGTAFGSSPELSTAAGWALAGSGGSFSATGTSSPATTGVNYAIVIPPAASGGSSGTVTLATAQGTGTANPLTINGTTTVVGGTEWPPAPYRRAVRSGGISYEYIFSATVGGVPVAGAQDLRPTGGSITDTTKPGVRRTLSLDLAPDPGLADLLAPGGLTLTGICRVRYQDRSTCDIPMGVFDVDSNSVDEGAGSISITAPDKWVRIQRSRFLVPQASAAGFPVVQQIAQLIQGAIPGAEVSITATSLATTPALVWDQDRDKAILDLANDIGAWVYFDRQGGAVIADIPQLGASADWLIDASPTGVLTSLKSQQSRTETRNVVVVTSSASGGPAFAPQIVWDNESESPTYAGTNPLTNPGSAGPFGIVPAFLATPVLSSASEAYAAGAALLSRLVGFSSQPSLSQVPNPAMDAFQTFDLLPPQTPFRPSRPMQRHVVDTVTHPLRVDQPTNVDARAIRTDPFISQVT